MWRGGGGGGGSGGGGEGTGTPSFTAAPNAVLTATNQTATDLVNAANAGASAALKANGLSVLPYGVQTSPAMGVTGTDTYSCTYSGSYTETYNVVDINAPRVGDTAHEVLNSCSELTGYAISGTMDLTVTRYVGASDFAVSLQAYGVTVTYGGTTSAPAAFSGQIDYNGSNISIALGIDGQSVMGAVSVLRSGNTATIAAATTRDNIGSSGTFVQINFSGWVFDSTTGRPSAGTATITGSGGTSGAVVVMSDGYHVTINVGGTPTSFVVAF